MHSIKADLEVTAPVRVGGTLGPRSDGYNPSLIMSLNEAADYHRTQIRSFVDAGADRVIALTLGYVDEAAGICRAATDLGLPSLLGFTVETDGRLPDGTSLRHAIQAVDALTDGAAAGFLVNCAHPDHIAPALADAGPWLSRLIGVRPNARGSATPSWTRHPTWTTVTPRSSACRSPGCVGRCRRSAWSEAAAAPTSGTREPSRRPSRGRGRDYSGRSAAIRDNVRRPMALMTGLESA